MLKDIQIIYTNEWHTLIKIILRPSQRKNNWPLNQFLRTITSTHLLTYILVLHTHPQFWNKNEMDKQLTCYKFWLSRQPQYWLATTSFADTKNLHRNACYIKIFDRMETFLLSTKLHSPSTALTGRSLEFKEGSFQRLIDDSSQNIPSLAGKKRIRRDRRLVSGMAASLDV